jgi:hypothetical protein
LIPVGRTRLCRSTCVCLAWRRGPANHENTACADTRPVARLARIAEGPGTSS